MFAPDGHRALPSFWKEPVLENVYKDNSCSNVRSCMHGVHGGSVLEGLKDDISGWGIEVLALIQEGVRCRLPAMCRFGPFQIPFLRRSGLSQDLVLAAELITLSSLLSLRF
jgi:hypothetical protein